MSHLELRLLGPFQASLDGRPINNFGSDKNRFLLSYLVTNTGNLYHREYLAGQLYPQASREQSLSNFRQTLYRLRRTLANGEEDPRFLINGHGAIGFNGEANLQVDVLKFEALLNANGAHDHDRLENCTACMRRLQAAVNLYRGDFLSGLALPEGRALEDWRVLVQEGVHTRAVAGLQTLASHFEAQEDYAQAGNYLRQLLAWEPWREEDHRRLMHLLAQDGQTAAALAQYEQCCAVLKAEWGAEPGPATTTLADAIRAGRFLTAPDQAAPRKPATEVVPHVLAASRLPKPQLLLGRKAELDRLSCWLRYERFQVISILGMGGIGKTALAAQIVHDVAVNRQGPERNGQPPDGGRDFDQVLWRSLVNAPPLSDVLANWLQVLKYDQNRDTLQSVEAQVDLLVALLSQQSTLLVLDNFESILDRDERGGKLRPGYEAYAYLLQAMAERDHRSCLLVTSREEARVLARLERSKSVVAKLRLAGLARPAGRQFVKRWSLLGDDNSLAQLNDRYSGNPLALELVAETIDELYAGDVAAFLAEPVAIYEQIEDVLTQQVARLIPLEWRLLTWLAVTRVPQTVAELHGNLIDGEPRQAVLAAMRRLHHSSLVERQEGDGGTHFYLQNVIIEFVTDRLVSQICQEIVDEKIDQLDSHALLTPTAEAYVVESQRRMIVQRVGRRLLACDDVERLSCRLKGMVATVQQLAPAGRGYAVGNLLNLMLAAGVDVRGMNVSGLTLRYVDLQDAQLPQVNLSGVTFDRCRFADTFAGLFSVAVSPDGALLAATTATGALRLWRRADGRQVADLPILAGYLWSVAFSPDGHSLAAAGDDAKIYLFRLHQQDDDIRLFPERVLGGHAGPIRSLCFHPSGNELASGSVDGSVRLWPWPATAEIVAGESGVETESSTRLSGHTDRVFRVVYSPDGRLLASAGADMEIRVWVRETGRCLWTLTGHEERIAGLAFAPDSRTLASGSVDTEIRLWRMETGKCEQVLRRHSTPLLSVAFSPDGRFLASAGHGATIRLWETQGWQTVRQFQAESYGGGKVWALCFSPDSRQLLSGGAQIPLQQWDLLSGLCNLRLHPWYVAHTSVAFHASGRLILTGSTDGRLRLWDTERCQHEPPVVTHRTAGLIVAVAVDPQGRWVATGDSTGLIQIWTLAHERDRLAFELVQEISQIRNGIASVQFTPDGRYFIANSQQGNIHFWRAADTRQAPLTLIRHASAHRHEALGLAIHPQSRYAATGGDDKVVRLWDVHSGQCVGEFEVATSRIWSLDYSPDGSMLLIACADGTIVLFGLKDRQILDSALAHLPGVRIARFTGQDSCVSAGFDGTLILWQIRDNGTLARKQAMDGHVGLIFDLRSHPQQTRFVTVGQDGTVRLWDCRSGESLAVWQTPGPYRGANIRGALGLNGAQKKNLLALGAVEAHNNPPRIFRMKRIVADSFANREIRGEFQSANNVYQ